ncbi:MAG: branched-chain amino acid ABC transporter ATP-binding protein/permease [Hyphomicrobiaceae bacterium]|nr:branched-chain amino acid ABC transporter ATP-binding protein/permease [Hyphomicrobiaceae bacterium]
MTRAPLVALLAVLLALAVVPGIPPFWITLANNIGLAALVTLGLVLLTGVGGMTSFGQAAFVGIGAYTTAVLTTVYGLSPWASLPLVLLVTGFVAALLGLMTVRLPGFYLPLGTIAWGISLYFLFGKLDLLGRYDGIGGIPPLSIAGVSLASPQAMYVVIWLMVLAAFVATGNLLSSRTGRAIRALRGGGSAAESFGVDRARTKLTVFIYAGLLAGLSGWLYAHLQRSVNPTPFGLGIGIEYLFMAVLGGAGHIWGALVGAGAIVLLKDLLQRVTPMLVGADLQMEAVVFGAIIVIMLQTARDGLWPRLVALYTGGHHRQLAVPQADSPLPPRPAVAPGLTRRLLEVEAASKNFGGLMAVKQVSFGVSAGEIVVLIGPNGAGKSTTFNLITGVLGLSSGKVSFDGHVLADASPRQAAALGMARTFQHVKLVPDMTVLENVALGAHRRARAGTLRSLLRLDRAEEARILADAARQIDRVGLTEHLSKPAGSLALGQQRLVEIARALALDPRLILLDEPAAGLRHFEKQALAELLSKLRAEGLSVLLVEHDMGFVMGLADRIVVLNFGTLIAKGTPAEIRTHPAVIEAYLGGTE